MFTHPDSMELPLVNGKPAHLSCEIKYHARKRHIHERIECLTTLKPATESESEAVQKELFQLMGKEVP